VGVDGLVFVVVDRPGLKVMFGHAKRSFDLEQLMVGVDDELRCDCGRVEVGGVALDPGQGAGFGLQLPVDTLGGTVEFDEPVALDRNLARYGVLGFGDLFVDAVQGATRPVGAVLVVDSLVTAVLVRAGRPRLSEDVPVGQFLAGRLLAPLVNQEWNLADPVPSMNEPGRFDGPLVGIGDHAGVGDHVTSVNESPSSCFCW
jgi:hypothetical protein